MSEMPFSSSEGTNNYVFDPEATPEMVRLINLDRVTTKGMGDLLAGVPVSDTWSDILDVACGPGGWVLDVAFARPDINVVGIDISQNMVRYANTRVRSQGLANASFRVMNIIQPLDFDDASFDFVNARFLVGVLRREQWSVVLAECKRVLRPGGVLRLTDMDMPGETNSLAYETLTRLTCQAMKPLGYGFSVDGRTLGITNTLTTLLRTAGFQQVQLRAHAIDFSAGMEAWADLFHNTETASRQIQPLVLKMGLATEQEFQRLSLQGLIDMQESTFSAIWHYTSAWGIKPE